MRTMRTRKDEVVSGSRHVRQYSQHFFDLASARAGENEQVRYEGVENRDSIDGTMAIGPRPRLVSPVFLTYAFASLLL